MDIIIPVYNTAIYLKRCLDSISMQTYKDWRAICVDDGSTDNSGRILDEYAAADKRFHVIHTVNGGISAARNIAMDIADSEWIMFVDSDDLIHPQTLEIALYLADRDGSDIVSWYRSRRYRWQVKLRRRLRMDTLNVIPWGFRRKYSLDKIRSVRTDDLVAHCSELTHPHIFMPVKHFYVWRHLIRRELTKDIRFINGLKFEDFPYWSELLLKRPKATITKLFLYYRYPNLESTVNTSKTGETVMWFLKGLEYSDRLYSARADRHQKEMWSRNCKWVVIARQIVGKLDEIHDPEQLEQIRRMLSKLWVNGVFNDCATPAERLVLARIRAFIPAFVSGQRDMSRYTSKAVIR